MDERSPDPVYDPAAALEHYERQTPALSLDVLADGEIRELGAQILGTFIDRLYSTTGQEHAGASLDEKVAASLRVFASRQPARAAGLVSEILADPRSAEGDLDTAQELSVGLMLSGAAQGFDCLMAVAYAVDPRDGETLEAHWDAQSVLTDLRAVGRLTPDQLREFTARDTEWQRIHQGE